MEEGPPPRRRRRPEEEEGVDGKHDTCGVPDFLQAAIARAMGEGGADVTTSGCCSVDTSWSSRSTNSIQRPTSPCFGGHADETDSVVAGPAGTTTVRQEEPVHSVVHQPDPAPLWTAALDRPAEDVSVLELPSATELCSGGSATASPAATPEAAATPRSVLSSAPTASPLSRSRAPGPRGGRPRAGALFRCAVCRELVYESELDYHVTICPDPGGDGNPPPGGLVAGAASAGGRPSGAAEELGHEPCPLDAGPSAAVASESAAAPPTQAAAEAAAAVRESALPPSPPQAVVAASGGTGVPRVGGMRRSKSAGHTAATRKATTMPLSAASAATAAVMAASPSRRKPTSTPRDQSSVLDSPHMRIEGAASGHDPAGLSAEPPKRSKSAPPMGAPRRGWTGWKGSDLERHHAAAQEINNRKRLQIQEERQRREVEECTFAPQFTARRANSGGANGRSMACSTISDDDWQLGRRRRLERLEAELYADVTLRPQISPFAQAWSARERRGLEAMADRDGQPPQTVFERLYHVAIQENASTVMTCKPRSAQSDTCGRGADTTSSGEGDGGTSGTVGAPRVSTTGRASSSHLLYNDALDRKVRQRAMEEQLSEQEETERRAACQVLARSRRYYWQMLDRQIKEAFEATADGEEILTFPALEDFLKRFGSLRSAKAPTPLAAERAAEESRRLRAAMWRHLDPNGDGYVDFLTLTVFLHVLMGAVDEEVQCSHSLTAAQQESPEQQQQQQHHQQQLTRKPTQQSCVLHELQNHESWSWGGEGPDEATPAVGSSFAAVEWPGCSSSNRALAAIFEEVAGNSESGDEEGAAFADNTGGDGTFAPGSGYATPSPSDQSIRSFMSPTSASTSAAAAAAATIDPEGQRICELLMRFNPKQLRAEFRHLYLDRMHHGATLVTQPAAEQEMRAPELNEQSRAMAERLSRRQRGDAGRAIASHAELMHWRHEQAKAKKEEQRAQREADEVQECTFRPSLRPTSSAGGGGGGYERPAARGLLLHDRLYADATGRRREMEAKAAVCEHRRTVEEFEECTFRPDTAKSERSYMRHGSTRSRTTPRGFDECKQRMRRAFAGHAQQKRLLDDRFLPIDTSSLASEHAPGERETPRTPTRREQPPLSARAPPTARKPRGGAGPAAGGLASAPTAASPPTHRSVRGGGRRVQKPPQGAVAIDGNGPSQPSARRVPSPAPGTAADAAARRPPNPLLGELATPKPQYEEEEGEEARFLGEPARPPLLYVEVNIVPGEPPERLVLRAGQSSIEAAADFAVRHHLSPILAQKLHSNLKQLLAKPEEVVPGRQAGTTGGA